MTFQFPMFAYALLLPAALLLAGLWYQRRRAQAFAALGQARHFSYLQPHRWWAAYGSLVVLIGCSLLIAIALLHPRKPMPSETGTLAMAGTDIAIAVDVSNSMLAADLPPSRLLQAARLLQLLTDTLANNRMSFTAFAGEAYLQMPLTSDMEAATSMAGTLSTGMVPVQGTSLANALKVAAGSLQRSQSARKAMILLTDGETHDEDSGVVADSLREQGIMLIAIGIGNPEGALLTNEKGMPIRDEEGNQVVSRLNETLLQELAAATSGEYHRFTRAEDILVDVLQDLKGMEQKKLVNASMLQHRSYAGWLLWPAFLWLLGSWFWGKWKANQKSFTRPALTAWLLAFLPMMAMAQQAGLDKARKAYESGNLTSAEQGFLQVLRNQPDQEVAHFYLGNIYFKQNRFAEAAKHYEQSRSYQQQKAERASSSNNLGLAQANGGQLDDAIDALKTALRNNPFDADIQHNLNVALQQKRKQNQQPPPPQQQPPRKPDPKMDALEKEEQKARQKQQQQQSSAGGDTKKW